MNLDVDKTTNDRVEDDNRRLLLLLCDVSD